MNQFFIRRDNGGRTRRFADQKCGSPRFPNGMVPQGSRGWGGQWDCNLDFPSVEDAIDCILSMRRIEASLIKLAVVDENGKTIWSEKHGFVVFSATSPTTAGGSSMAEMHISTGENQPLHIARETLLTQLRERQAEEQKKREEADAAVKARRQEAVEAVATLSPVEMLTLVQKQYGQDLDAIVEMVKEAKETKRLIPADSKPNVTETRIDKWVRVLDLASDEQIEVTPTDEVYSLL